MTCVCPHQNTLDITDAPEGFFCKICQYRLTTDALVKILVRVEQARELGGVVRPSGPAKPERPIITVHSPMTAPPPSAQPPTVGAGYLPANGIHPGAMPRPPMVPFATDAPSYKPGDPLKALDDPGLNAEQIAMKNRGEHYREKGLPMPHSFYLAVGLEPPPYSPDDTKLAAAPEAPAPAPSP